MCSKNVSTFRASSGSFLKEFQQSVLADALKHTAPVLWMMLNAAATSLGIAYVRKDTNASSTPACIMAAAGSFTQPSEFIYVCGMQCGILSLLLWHGRATTIVRLYKHFRECMISLHRIFSFRLKTME